MQKSNNALFFTCSLIEYIGRETKNKRRDVVNLLGNDVDRIFNYADVFHCEPIAKVADDFISRNNIPEGDYDNVAKAKYRIPDYWDIGEVFERLIEDTYSEEDYIKGVVEVYSSWICELIENYNSDMYYQSRDYLAECYKEGTIIAS